MNGICDVCKRPKSDHDIDAKIKCMQKWLQLGIKVTAVMALVTTIFFLSLMSTFAFADVQNIQVFENQSPLNVEASNPAIVSVSPDSFVYGTLDTSNYPQIVCQLEDCLWQVESQGYTGYHIRFSGVEPNNTAIVKVSDFGFVFEPKVIEKQESHDPSGVMFIVQTVPAWVYGVIGGVVWLVVMVVKKKKKGLEII